MRKLTLRRQPLVELRTDEMQTVAGGNPTMECTTRCTQTATVGCTNTCIVIPQSVASCENCSFVGC